MSQKLVESRQRILWLSFSISRRHVFNILQGNNSKLRDSSFVLYHIDNLIFLRNIDELPKDISRDVIDRLKSFPSLDSDEEIQVWHNFCKTSPHQSVTSMFYYISFLRAMI